MPGGRPPKDLEPFQIWICEEILSGTTVKEIVGQLKEHESFQISERTLYTRFKEWGLKQNVRLVWDRRLFERINDLYFQEGFNNTMILEQLVNEGFVLSKWHVIQLEHIIGIYRRESVNSPLTDELLLGILYDEMNKGPIEQLGRTMLQARFRRSGLAVSRYVYFLMLMYFLNFRRSLANIY